MTNPDIPLAEPITRIRTADIRAMLNRFHDCFGLENIEYEVQVTHAAHGSGLLVAQAGKIIQVTPAGVIVVNYECAGAVSTGSM